MKNEKGAASILIILLMIFLVTLGAFAITSANANKNLSQKAIDWNKTFYVFDSIGEEILASLDSRLAEAEFLANEYIAAYNSGSDIVPNIKINANEINLSLKSNDNLLAFSNLYIYYLDELFNEWSEDYPDISLGKNDDSYWLEYEIKSKYEDLLGGIHIWIWIDSSMYSLDNDGKTIVRKDNSPRYLIEDWYQQQPAVDIEPPVLSLWDGVF